MTITSAAEQTFVAGLVNGRDLWIGAQRTAPTPAPWGWNDGESWGYTNWDVANGEPNEPATPACARIRTTGLWADRPCANIYGAICEVD